MSEKPKNSVAAALSTFVLIIMWIVTILGAPFIIFVGLQLLPSSEGQQITLPGLVIGQTIDSLPVLVTGLLGALVIVPGILYVCVQLRRILSTLASGDPFVPANAGRLTKIAVAILVIQLLRYAIAIIVGAAFDEATLSIRVDLMAWAAIAALFILAQVFREGTRLRQEEKMTI